MTTLERYNVNMKGTTEPNAIERLRFFLSLALTGQDWIDVEQFIAGVSQQLALRDAEVAEARNQYTTGVTDQRERASEFPTTRDEIESLRQRLTSRDAEVAELKQTCIDHVEIQNALREQVNTLRSVIMDALWDETWWRVMAKEALAATE